MLMYGKCECFVMQILYVCASCGSSQCCVLHDLQFNNAGRGCRMRPYGLHQTTYPSSPQLTYDMTTDYNKTDGQSPTTRKLTGHNSRKTHGSLSLRPPYPPIYTLPTEFLQTSY